VPELVTEHPTAEQLRAFADGRLEPADFAAVEAHVSGCAVCCQFLESAPADSFLGRVRAVEQAAFMTTTDGSAPTLTDPRPVPPELTDHPKYRVLALVGQGGMGAVYRAEHRRMDRTVALKVINPALLRNPATVNRFHQEVRTAARLDHPNIVRAHDADQAGELHFLVMEFVEGTSLADVVARGPVPAAQACGYARQVALGLQHAHERGMVHRDIKPHNLMLTPEGVIKILDFGLARFAHQEDEQSGPVSRLGGGLTTAGAVLGTADYIAPEQVRDARSADIRSDIYSLGCTLFHLLTGRQPFLRSTNAEKFEDHAKTPLPIPQEWPEELKSVLRKMTAKDPRDRFTTPAEVATALEPLTHLTAARGKPRRRWLVAALVLLAGGLTAGVVILRVPTDKGEVVFTTDDDSLELTVRKGGEIVRIRDPNSGQTWDVDTKHYLITALDHPDGLIIELPERGVLALRKKDGGKVTVTTGPKVVLTPVAQPTVVRQTDPAALAKLPNAADGLKRSAIPKDALTDIGGGDPENAPPELVAVLGDTQFRGSARLEALAFSPDGKYLASSDRNGTTLWDLATARAVATWKEVRGHRLVFSPDGKLLAVARKEDVWVHRVADGKLIYSIDAKTKPRSESVTFSPDGTLIATSGGGGTVRIWRASDGQELRILSDRDILRSLLFSPDGSKLVAVGASGIMVWEVQGGQDGKSLFVGYPFECAEWLPDGTTLLAFARGGSYSNIRPAVLKLDLENGKVLENPETKAPTGATTLESMLSPGARFLASVQTQGVVLTQPGTDPERQRLFRLSPSREIPKDATASAAFSPDGRYLAFGNPEGVISVLRLSEKGALPELQLLPPPVAELADRPSAADALKHADIPEDARAYVAGGVAAKAPPELVAVLGDIRFRCTDYAKQPRYSPDGKFLIVFDGRRGVVFFDAVTGRAVRRVSGVEGNGAILSPDNKILAVTSDYAIELWDVEKNRRLYRFDEKETRLVIPTIAFSPDGTLLAAGSGTQRRVRVWEVATGKEQFRWNGVRDEKESAPIKQVAFSADGQLLAANCWLDEGVRFWTVPPGGKFEETKLDAGFPREGAELIAFSPDGKSMAVWDGSNGQVWICDSNGKPRHHLPARLCNVLAFSSDSRTLVATRAEDEDRSHYGVRRWDVATGKVLSDAGITGIKVRSQCTLSPDGKTLAALGLDFQTLVRLFDTQTGKPLIAEPGHARNAGFLTFSPDGKTLLSFAGGQLKLWDLATAKALPSWVDSCDGKALPVFSPDGRMLARAYEGVVDVHDISSGKVLQSFTGPEKWITSVAFSPDGQLLAVGGGDRLVWLWRVRDGKTHRILDQQAQTDALAFTPDGKLLISVTGEHDYTYRVWNVATGEENQRPQERSSSAYTLALKPDGKTLVGLEYDGRVWLRDCESGTVKQQFPRPEKYGGEKNFPMPLALAPTGWLAAKEDSAGRLLVWQPDSSPLRRRAFRLGPAGGVGVECVAISPDGRYTAVGTPGGIICVLRLSDRGQVPVLPAMEIAPMPHPVGD
jgi:WD40 repeat protein/serine/threonine protein kinase